MVSVKDKTNVIMVVQDFIAFVGIYGGFGQRHFRDMFQLNPLILSRGSHFSNSKKLQKIAQIAQIAQIAFPIQDEKNLCDHSQQSKCE